MKTIKKRKVNVKNCYILFVSALAIISLGGNFAQDHFYTNVLDKQQTIIETMNEDMQQMQQIQTASLQKEYN